MRLWHQDLIPLLPRQQLLGQHRECCALRGKGWGKKHATVNYVFNHSYFDLYCYHCIVMLEMRKRRYNVDLKWFNPNYRGKILGYDVNVIHEANKLESAIEDGIIIYPEHDDNYKMECLENLQNKNVKLLDKQS